MLAGGQICRDFPLIDAAGDFVREAVGVPVTGTDPDAVSEPENVLLLLKVRVPARIANSLDALGRVKLRAAPVLIPRQRKQRFLRRIGGVHQTEVGVRYVLWHTDRMPGTAIPDNKSRLIRELLSKLIRSRQR